MRTRLAALAAAAVLAATTCAGSAGADRAAATPNPGWPNYHNNIARTGVYTAMPAASGTPKLYRSIKLDAAVYASPIVGGGVIAVATENDSVYGITSHGQVLWHRTLGRPARRSQLPCGNINPSGITGTPAYSSATGLLYLVVEHANPVRHAMAAINIQTGAVAWTRQLTLPGTSQDAMQERAALTVTGGRVWVTFGGRAGDCGNYKGRLIGVPLSGSGTAVAYTVPTAREAGMWAPPGPSVDSAGHLYVAVGNGAAVVGDPYDHSDSVLKLDSHANLLSSFSPTNWASDNAADLDLGSQGPALVGGWIFQAGKSGTAYVLRQSALGGIGGQVSSSALGCRSFGGTAVSGNAVYVPCTGGVRKVLISATGTISSPWQAASSITGSPVIGGGRIWALDTGGGVLHGLSSTTGTSLGSVSVGATSRFATPALYGNKVLIGTLTGLAIVTTSP